MIMIKSLKDCTVSGPFRTPPSPFAAVGFSLNYQSGRLGLKVVEADDYADQGTFSFVFRAPQARLVNCVITGWSDCDQPGAITESMMQAACGLMSVHGRSTGAIQPFGLQYVSTVTTALALQGGMAAALGNLRGLAVSDSHISMAAAALLSTSQYIADATSTSSSENLSSADADHSPAPPFISADGIVFELETLNPDPWLRFWTQLGISRTLAGKGWTAFLLRYAKAIAPIPGELTRAVSKLGYADISRLCADAGMAICRVRTLDERMDDEHFKSNWLKGPWVFDCAVPQPELPLTSASGLLPLSGLTVIESCRRIQGPLAGHLLALLGARVIRIEPPGGDPLRGMPPVSEGCSVRFDALNRLKVIREIDIKSPCGQEEITEMARHADVFLHNWAPGKALELDLDYADLSRVNPALIYAHASGWFTDGGEISSRSPSLPGTDFMVQAYSGVAQKISRTCGTQGGTLFTALDVLGGVIAAQGITAALLNRQLNCAGAKVTSSLLGAAILLCSDDFQNRHDFFDCVPPAQSVLNRVFETGKGKIAIECLDDDTLLRLMQTLDLSAGDKSELWQRLGRSFLGKTAAEWLVVLQQAAVPAAIVIEDLNDLHGDPRLKPYLEIGSYTRVTSPWRFQ